MTGYAISVNHNELTWLIRKAYQTKRGLFILGPPGIGKSYLVSAVAKKIATEKGKEFVDWVKTPIAEKLDIVKDPRKYFLYIDIRLAMSDPSDLKGVPALNGDFVEWKSPLWVYALCQDGADGFAFFDEYNLAPHLIQSASYQAVYDKAIGENAFAKDISPLAAGNRPEDGVKIFSMQFPLKRRFTWVELLPPKIKLSVSSEMQETDWTAWAADNGIDARIISFLQKRPGLLFYDFMENDTKAKRFGPSAKSHAQPMPATWEFCSDLIKGETDLHKLKLASATAVGEGAAREFEAHLKAQRKVDMERLIEGKQEIPDDVDIKYALIGGVSEYCRQHRNKSLWDKVFKNVVEKLEAEYQYLILRILWGIDKKLCHRVLPNEFVVQYVKYFLSAG